MCVRTESVIWWGIGSRRQGRRRLAAKKGEIPILCFCKTLVKPETFVIKRKAFYRLLGSTIGVCIDFVPNLYFL